MAALLLVAGCGRKKVGPQESIIVSLEPNESRSTEIASVAARTIVLGDESEDAIIGPVKRIFTIYSDLYIHHNQTMSRFDRDGNFLGNIGLQGRGPGEYSSMWSSWIRNDSLFMYDLNSKMVMSYDPARDTLNSYVIENDSPRFQAVIPFGRGYVGKLGYTGTRDGSELGFYDENYALINTIGEMKLQSGLNLGNPFSKYGEDEVLYWRQMENNIYAIHSDSTIRIKYIIDFKGKNVPEMDFADEYEKIDYINKSPDNYATVLSNVSETDDKLLFTFVYRENRHLAVFDKSSRQTEIYHFTLPSDQTLNDIVVSNENIFVVADALNRNSTVYILDMELLTP